MKIILAQGNPGAQYASSRHNVGFIAIDELARRNNADYTNKTKFHAAIAEFTIAGEKVLLVKPTTFYNETGQAARLIADFYKVDPATGLLVIHDDLSLPFGTLRIRSKGSDAGNNGVKSLNAHLGPDYTRIRIGIYNDLRQRIPDVDFVLSSFTKSEMANLRSLVVPKIHELIAAFCDGTLTATSHTVELPDASS